MAYLGYLSFLAVALLVGFKTYGLVVSVVSHIVSIGLGLLAAAGVAYYYLKE